METFQNGFFFSCLWPESQGLYYHLLKLQVNTHNHLKSILKNANWPYVEP